METEVLSTAFVIIIYNKLSGEVMKLVQNLIELFADAEAVAV